MDDVDGGKVKKAAGGRKAGKPRKKAVTRSVKAGLQLPVSRIGRYLKKSQPVDLLSAAPSPSAAPTLFHTASMMPPTLFRTTSVTPLLPLPHRPSSPHQL
uniref:Uncharacterized protein n=1 Tax=Oryza nivara TaxID=4536 RepID=A0A0E0I2B5_ORYNI